MFKVLRNGLLLFTRVAFGHSVGAGYFSMLIPVDDVDIKFVLHANDFFKYPDVSLFVFKGSVECPNGYNDGRFVASSRKKRVQVLAAARLHRCPGLFEVLTALKEYRVACSEGYAKVSPSNAFQPDALDWLEPQEENASWNPKKSDAALEGKKQLKTLYCRVGERPGLGVYIYMFIFIVILRSLFRYTRRPALMGKWLLFQLLNLFATSEVNAVWQMWCQWCLHHKIVPKSGCILVWCKKETQIAALLPVLLILTFFEAARFVRRLRLNVFLFKVGSQGCQGCRAVYGCI